MVCVTFCLVNYLQRWLEAQGSGREHVLFWFLLAGSQLAALAIQLLNLVGGVADRELSLSLRLHACPHPALGGLPGPL